jgi:hypothetical protein
VRAPLPVGHLPEKTKFRGTVSCSEVTVEKTEFRDVVS